MPACKTLMFGIKKTPLPGGVRGFLIAWIFTLTGVRTAVAPD
jgi:hypothetical protein